MRGPAVNTSSWKSPGLAVILQYFNARGTLTKLLQLCSSGSLSKNKDITHQFYFLGRKWDFRTSRFTDTNGTQVHAYRLLHSLVPPCA